MNCKRTSVAVSAVFMLLTVAFALPAWASRTYLLSPGTDVIKNAITLTNSGDILVLEDGTYAETGQIVIPAGKDLTIIGRGQPIIVPASPITTTSADSTSAPPSSIGWWYVATGANLSLQNVILDGAGSQIFAGIFGEGTGTIDGCVLRNIAQSGYHGFGLWLQNNWTVTNNTFNNMGREGVMFKYSSVTKGLASGNIYNGKGAGDWLDYGIELSAGAVATITNNTISNCIGVASTDGSTSGAVQISTYYADRELRRHHCRLHPYGHVERGGSFKLPCRQHARRQQHLGGSC